MEEHSSNIAQKIVCASDQIWKSATTLQQVEKTEEHSEMYQDYAISKIQTLKNSIGQTAGFIHT